MQATALALQSLLRRDALDAAASRVALFHDLADYFKLLAVFPPDAIEDLSDEQYVRNVVETVYRRPG